MSVAALVVLIVLAVASGASLLAAVQCVSRGDVGGVTLFAVTSISMATLAVAVAIAARGDLW